MIHIICFILAYIGITFHLLQCFKFLTFVLLWLKFKGCRVYAHYNICITFVQSLLQLLYFIISLVLVLMFYLFIVGLHNLLNHF